MTRIIVVAHYPTIRAGLVSLLDAEDLSVVAEADDPAHLVDLIEEHLPDVVLIDLVDDPPDRLQPLQELADSGLLPALVLLAGSATDALAGLTLPDTSLLLRDATREEIHAALRATMQGLVTLDPRIVQEISRQLDVPAPSRLPDVEIRLTPREQEVLQMIALGLPNKSIAHELGISEHTVKFHVGSIFEKLDVASRSEAIVVAARSGLLVL